MKNKNINYNESIVLGGGCFWCLDAGYRLISGVNNVIPGYADGKTFNPSYNDVSTGNTGHAEVVKVEFDNSKITLNDILDIFWAIHNPTTRNRQGNDIGSQYRSIILWTDKSQLSTINDSVARVSLLWNDPITTEVKELRTFYSAEEEHQNYFQKHPDRAYCQVIINPKLAKLKMKFADRLKAINS